MKDLNFAAHFSLTSVFFFHSHGYFYIIYRDTIYSDREKNEMIFDTTMNLKKITNFDEVIRIHIYTYTRIHGHIKHV